MTVTDVTTTTKISGEERQAIEDALFAYYAGEQHTISEALTTTKGTGVGTYYQRRKDFPDEILGIQKTARLKAREFIAGQRQALDAEAIAASKELQANARKALQEGLESLAIIARGEMREYSLDDKERDGTQKVKTILPYPRDIVGAMKILQELARGGVLPEGNTILPPEYATEEQREPMIPILGIGADFTRVTATAMDGTQYTATVTPGVVIDAEEMNDD